jgi:hypothetical protein
MIFEVNGQTIEGINRNGILYNKDNQIIYGIYFRGKGITPLKYPIEIKNNIIVKKIKTHNGTIRESFSSLVGIWDDIFEHKKEKITKINYKKWFDQSNDGHIEKLSQRINKIEKLLSDTKKNEQYLIKQIDNLNGFIKDCKLTEMYFNWRKINKGY